MKRFTKSNLAYACQAIAVVILFGFPAQSANKNTKKTSAPDIRVMNNNNKNIIWEVPQHGVKVSRYDMSNSGEKVLSSSGMLRIIFRGSEIFLEQGTKPANR